MYLENSDQGDKLEIESNYGSEFGTDDENALSSLLRQAESHHPSQLIAGPVRQRIEEDGDAAIRIAYEHDIAPAVSVSDVHKLAEEDGVRYQAFAFHGPIRQASIEFEYDTRNRVAFSRE